MIYSSVSRADISNRGLIHHYISQPHNLDAKMLTHDYLFVCMLSSVSCFCCRLLPFLKINFFKKIFQEHYHHHGLKQLDPGQDRHFFGPDLGQNCFQRLSKVAAWKELGFVDTNEACCQKSFFRLCFQLKLTPDSSGHSRIQKVLSEGVQLKFCRRGSNSDNVFFS